MTAPSQMRLPVVCRGVVFCLLALYAVLACAPAVAGDSLACCPQPRLQDQLWLVSHRGLDCNVEEQVENLEYWRYDREKRWVRSGLAELVAADDGNLITSVFVHGNRISSCEAFTKGWSAYQTLARCGDERPVRWIVWSWPSERAGGPIKDAQEKACRTDPSAYYLAWFVDQLNPDEPVSLWGHSFGARIVTGALHLLGGGQVAGRRLLKRAHATRRPMQVMLIAAALDNDWLFGGHAHGQALSQIEGMLLVNNGCDALLKRYHRIYQRRSCRQALGYTGLSRCWLDADAWSKIEQVDACCQVGRRHVLDGYLCAPGLVALMRKHLFFEPLSGRSKLNEAVAAANECVAAD
ncbi:MAG: hypothetical protein WD063_05755 [Pirellulales bacterium]